VGARPTDLPRPPLTNLELFRVREDSSAASQPKYKINSCSLSLSLPSTVKRLQPHFTIIGGEGVTNS